MIDQEKFLKESIDGTYLRQLLEEDEEFTDRVISILEELKYKIQRPPREIKDEYTFQRAWDLYQKKVGCKESLERKWNSMSRKDRKAATEYIPAYVLSKPNKQYRKNFQTFLNQRGWEDELIGAREPTSTPTQKSDISKLIEDTKIKQESYTKEAKEHALRQRIYGMIEVVKDNPRSLCMDTLKYYHKVGLLEKLHIDWKP